MQCLHAAAVSLNQSFQGQLNRERLQACTATVLYRKGDKEYLLNMVDTPGHVDFSYEVARSLAACDGVLLLVDGAQGIQVQHPPLRSHD